MNELKTSLKKLKNFAALGNDGRARKQCPASRLDELARAAQNMNDVKDYYERLLSAAAFTANSVYEFAESLTEMGNCILEKSALDGDEKSGKVLTMMGRVQFELQKLVDGYRSHIIQTITVPSESLLNELRVVEDMKKRCDDKREICEELKKRHKEQGISRKSKNENFSLSQLQQLQDGYEEEANAFVFRMKSLKQGQSRSFLTQASRHYSAQLSFFRRAVRSLEAIETHVKLLAEQHIIDYQISGLEDTEHETLDDSDDDRNDKDDSTEESSASGRYDAKGDLGFDHGRNYPSQDESDPKKLTELESRDASFTSDRKPEAAKELMGSYRNSFSFHRGVGAVSKSAPLFPGNKQNSAARVMELGPLSSGKVSSYVLPTPDEPRSSVSVKLSSEVAQKTEGTNHLKSAGINWKNSITLDIMKKASIAAPSITKDVSLNRQEVDAGFYAQKVTRQVHSGPIVGKPRPKGQGLSDTSCSSSALPLFSGWQLHTPLLRPSSNSQPSSQVPTSFAPSLKISELHELPRPPASGRQPHPITRSGPLVSRRQDLSTVSVSGTPIAASRVVLSRSYSVPAGGMVEVALQHPPES